MLAAVILCAGESSRMGFPKALAQFRGKTFLQRLLDVIREASDRAAIPASAIRPLAIKITRVVLGAHAEEIRGALALDPKIVVLNPNWKAGQLSSIQAALGSLPEECDGIVLFLVDHPLVNAQTLRHLIRQFQETRRPIVVPTFAGKRGHPVIFARMLFKELLAAPSEVGARAVVWAHAAEVLDVPTEDQGVLLNLNDPETLRRVSDQPPPGF